MALRPMSNVPLAVRLALAPLLALQLLWHGAQAPPQAQLRALAPAPSTASLQLLSLGEPIALSKLLMLYLQSVDDQAGATLPWRQLDYARLQDWLGAVLDLDPRAQYPLLAASEVYSAVSDPQRSRQMLEFVYARFSEDPNHRWPWLAHAALVAKHRLHDLPLARKYAQAIRLQATGSDVPGWARELEAFILEDMNELDSARIVVGALLQAGQITDPHELRFLEQHLDSLTVRTPPGKR